MLGSAMFRPHASAATGERVQIVMTSRTARASVGFLVMLATAAPPAAQSRSAVPKPAARPAAAPVARRVPFRPGETLTYDISWSSYLTAGVATLEVKDLRPSGGSVAYYIVAEGKATGLVSAIHPMYYKLDTLLDSRVLLPQRGSVYTQEGSRRRTRVTRFDHAAQRAEYEVQTPTVVTTSVGLARDSQDALSVVYALRAAPLKENSRLTMAVCESGAMYRVQFSVGKIEPVRVGASSIPAFRVTPTIADAKGAPVGRPTTLWISADSRQLPLKLHADLAIGSINLTLRDAAQ